MKAIDVIWFSPQGYTMGLVCSENSEGEKVFHIGVGEGFDPESDMQLIADWGAKFDLEYVNRFLEKMKQ